jgi:hypothetical protein
MPQDREILRNYVAAVRRLDEAALAMDRPAFAVRQRELAVAAQAYADDLVSNGFGVPHGLVSGPDQLGAVRS